MSQSKIIHIIAYFPPSLGGMEKVAEYLAVQQAHDNRNVEVVTSNIGYDGQYKDTTVPGYKVARLYGKKIANLPFIPGLLFHLLRQPRGSVFHCHVAQAFMPEVALIAARLTGSKFITHFHVDAAPSGTFGFIFSLYKKTLFPLMLRSCDAVIVFSDRHKQHIITKYRVAERKIHIVPNGVATEFFYKSVRKMHSPLRLLFVGRLESQKNLRMLLAGLSYVHTAYEATIVGTGDMKLELLKLKDRFKLESVSFVGRKTGNDLLSLYKKADIFVLTSDREGMPLVLLEAMAMGLPIIATNVEGTNDVVQDGKTGMLVPLNNREAFAVAIDTLAQEPSTYESMSKKAIVAASELSWERVARNIAEIYVNN